MNQKRPLNSCERNPKIRRRKMRRHSRRGAILIITAMLMIVLVFVLAVAVDLGYMFNTRAELQRSADAAAMAGCWEYYEVLAAGGTQLAADQAAREAAIAYVAANRVCNQSPLLRANWHNESDGDLVIGYLSDLNFGAEAIDVLEPGYTNAVRVTVRRQEGINGEAPLFFARALGRDSVPLNAVGTAAIVRHICGFKTPSDGSRLGILPFALDIETWNAMLAGTATDDYTWNAVDQVIEPGPDGILEVNLFPQGTGSPGNRGTVDIGSPNNSTNDIARQITDGISAEDLEYLGGELRFDDEGVIILNGDTGISAGVKDELDSIKGEPRIIPLYSQVVGPGNNADYTVVQLVGIRIMAVKLTGPMNKKHVLIQPAPVVIRGVIPSTPEDSCTQDIYSPVILVQ